LVIDNIKINSVDNAIIKDTPAIALQNVSNVIIKNLVIREFSQGISLDNTSQITITNLTAEGKAVYWDFTINQSYGLFLSNSQDIELSNLNIISYKRSILAIQSYQIGIATSVIIQSTLELHHMTNWAIHDIDFLDSDLLADPESMSNLVSYENINFNSNPFLFINGPLTNQSLTTSSIFGKIYLLNTANITIIPVNLRLLSNILFHATIMNSQNITLGAYSFRPGEGISRSTAIEISNSTDINLSDLFITDFNASVEISESDNVKITTSSFAAQQRSANYGISILQSEQLLINASTFQRLHTGVQVNRSDDITISHSIFTDIDRGVSISNSTRYHLDHNQFDRVPDAIDGGTRSRESTSHQQSVSQEDALVPIRGIWIWIGLMVITVIKRIRYSY